MVKFRCVYREKEYRKIRNDHTFSYNNKFYLIDGPIKHSISKQKIEIRTYQDGTFIAYFANQQLTVSEVIEPTKPALYEPEIQKKLDAIHLAEKLGNVAEAARISGCSRETIYKNRRLLEEKGPLALKRTFKADIQHKNRTPQNIEKIVIQFSLENPHLGQAQVCNHLKSIHNIELSPSGVRGIWVREKLNTCAMRIQRSSTYPHIQN